jgi:hypothetical protein
MIEKVKVGAASTISTPKEIRYCRDCDKPYVWHGGPLVNLSFCPACVGQMKGVK